MSSWWPCGRLRRGRWPSYKRPWRSSSWTTWLSKPTRLPWRMSSSLRTSRLSSCWARPSNRSSGKPTFCMEVPWPRVTSTSRRTYTRVNWWPLWVGQALGVDVEDYSWRCRRRPLGFSFLSFFPWGQDVAVLFSSSEVGVWLPPFLIYQWINHLFFIFILHNAQVTKSNFLSDNRST